MTSRFEITDTPLHGLRLLTRQPVGDPRGYLERLFCDTELGPLLPDGKTIVQINRTLTSKRGAIRGLHRQLPPHEEIKFVSCLRGRIFDVAVDLREDSPTYLRWHSEILSADNSKTFVIPEGFAHGFQTLTNDCELLYFHTAAWSPEAEAGLNALDPALGIPWPLEISEISQRDRSHPMLPSSTCPQ